ncbi:MAG: hypothetical protein GDA56_18940 [Hormoscilla sp. GM7CHS1pb]|nr:hypothetical protein [Hormoscilla sp. GM7CHS1pb]
MKIINYSRNNAQIQFAIPELFLLKYSLIEGYEQIRDSAFDEQRIRGISKSETLKLGRNIGGIIEQFKLDKFPPYDSQFFQLIQWKSDGVILQVPQKILLGICTFLNEISGGQTARSFQSKLGLERKQIASFIHGIRLLLNEMASGSLEMVIFEKSMTLFQELKLSRNNLESNVSDRITRECQLKLKEHLIVFWLVSLRDRRISVGSQVAVGQLSGSEFLGKSDQLALSYSKIIRIVPYLEIPLESAFDIAEMEKYMLIVGHQKRPMFKIKVPDNSLSIEGEKLLKIRFWLYFTSPGNEGDRALIEIEDFATATDIYAFTSSIREFLSELPRKDLNSSE